MGVSSWTLEQQWREREQVLTPRVPDVAVDRSDAGSGHVCVLDAVLIEERQGGLQLVREDRDLVKPILRGLAPP